MIFNRQREVRVSVAGLERFAARARKLLKIPATGLGISLVTRAEIARWNRAYRGKTGPTDVLSFPTTVAEPKSKRASQRAGRSRKRGHRASSQFFASSAVSTWYLGDIAIAPAIARANARRFGRTFDEEMRILVLHGMLHLMGYDHETDNGQMDRREQKLHLELGLK